MAEITLSRAKELCTAAEMEVVQASSRQTLNQLSQAELKKNVDLARKLRDKWRDQATRQRRSVQQQQGARTTEKTARSQEKAQLFGEVLSRFEQRWRQGAASPSAGGGAKKSAKTPKRQRAQTHRATRAATRSKLEEHRAEMERPAATRSKKAKKTVKKKTPAEPVAPQAGAAETPETRKSPATPSAAPKKKAAKKKTAKKAAPQKGAKTKASPKKGPGKRRDDKAATAAKKNRVNVSGLNTRIRGHVSARGKRAQSRRDSRR